MKYNPLLDLISKTMWQSEFNLTDEVMGLNNWVMSSNDSDWWERLENKLKSRSLNTFDYKISVLNQIIEIILEGVKEGISSCHLLDPKYFGIFKHTIFKCQRDIGKLNKIICQAKNRFNIPYFGKMSLDFIDYETETKLNTHFLKYLCNITQQLNPDMEESVAKELVSETIWIIAKHYNFHPEDDQGISSKLAFYTLVKLVEKSFKFMSIHWVYINTAISYGSLQTINKFNVIEVLSNAETKGMFEIILPEQQKLKPIKQLVRTYKPRKRDIKVWQKEHEAKNYNR